jgi:hypothetical protein
MPAQNAIPSRRIVISGLVAESPASEIAVSLVDEAGNTLNRVLVNEDGSCELPTEALASAERVRFEPIGVVVEADQFRKLIETGDLLDLTVLLAASDQPPSLRRAASVCRHRPKPPPTGY